MGNSHFSGIIFDMDGTLTVPTLDFARMREEIGLPGGDLAHAIMALPKLERDRAWAIIERHEAEAIDRQALQPGTRVLLQRCTQAGLRLALMTRNHAGSVKALCERFSLSFDVVVTRAFPHMKPHPGPVLHILEKWGALPASDVLVVGDHVHDIECGRNAGTRTCFFQNPGKPDHGGDADYSVSSMDELGEVVFG